MFGVGFCCAWGCVLPDVTAGQHAVLPSHTQVAVIFLQPQQPSLSHSLLSFPHPSHTLAHTRTPSLAHIFTFPLTRTRSHPAPHPPFCPHTGHPPAVGRPGRLGELWWQWASRQGGAAVCGPLQPGTHCPPAYHGGHCSRRDPVPRCVTPHGAAPGGDAEHLFPPVARLGQLSSCVASGALWHWRGAGGVSGRGLGRMLVEG